MTVESCIAFCDARSFFYAGVEWSQVKRSFHSLIDVLTEIWIFCLGMLCVRIVSYYMFDYESFHLDCGNYIANGGASTTITDCNMPCKGNPSESCGAGNRLNVYDNGGTPPPLPSVVPSVGQWESLGCYRYFCTLFNPIYSLVT
jgi:hypothetical protein